MEERQPIGTRARALDALPVLAILAVGLGLRLHGLHQQPLWGDEFCGSVEAIRCGSFSDYLAWCLHFGTAPLFPALEYWWARLYSPDSIAWLRVLPLCVGMASILVAYVIGCRVGSRFAGGLAALCVAFSTMQIWESQSLRPYPLLILMGSLSLYASLRILSGGRWVWWLLILFLNSLGFWAHWLYVDFIAVQFGLLLLFSGRRKMVLFWGVAHAVPAAYAVWRLMHCPPINTNWHDPMDLLQAWNGMFGEAIQCYNPDIPLVFLGTAQEGLLRYIHVILRSGLGFYWAGVVAVVAVMAARRLYRLRREGGADEVRVRSTQQLYLALALFLSPMPLIVLGSLSNVPFLLDRYLAPFSLIKFVALGVFVSQCPRWLARFAILPPLLCFAYALWLYLPAQTGTDWPRVAEYLRAHRQADEPVFTTYNSARNFERYVSPREFPSYVAYNDEVAVDVAAWVLAERHPSAPPAIWYLHRCNYNAEPDLPLDHELSALGFVYEKTVYPGVETLFLYRISNPGRWDSPPLLPDVAEADLGSSDEDDGMDWLTVLMCLQKGYSPITFKLLSARLQGLSMALNINATATFGLMLIQVGDCEVADDVTQWEMEAAESPQLYFARAVLLMASGDAEGAEDAFAKAFDNKYDFLQLAKPWMRALLDGKYGQAFELGEAMESSGIELGAQLRETARQFRDRPGARLPFGVTPVHAADYDGLAALFRPISDYGALPPALQMRLCEVFSLLGIGEGLYDATARNAAGASAALQKEQIDWLKRFAARARCLR